MYSIYAEFQRFRDVNLINLIGATGVYVIWDAHAKARPTYIGEGNILKRFTDHVKRDNRRFAHPWNGYVAIIAGSTGNVHKTESTVVERLILDVAKDTDREPIVNVHPGHANRVLRFCRDETLRVAISGYDPLLHPAESGYFCPTLHWPRFDVIGRVFSRDVFAIVVVNLIGINGLEG